MKMIADKGSADPRLIPQFQQNTSHGLSRRGPKMNPGNAGCFEKRDPNKERWENDVRMPSNLKGK